MSPAIAATRSASLSAKPKRSARSAMQQQQPPRAIERGVWSAEEHDKFLIGIKLFPEGPWKSIAEQVGTRSARQVQTHAQKYYEKVARRLRGLRKDRKKLVRPEHRLDDDMVTLCKVASSSDDALVSGLRDGPVRRGLNPIATLPRPRAVGSPSGVDAPVDAMDFDMMEPRERADSVDSQLVEAVEEPQRWQHELELSDCDVVLSDATDSGDDSDALLDFDDYCLDYLIEVLGSPEPMDHSISVSERNDDNSTDAVIYAL